MNMGNIDWEAVGSQLDDDGYAVTDRIVDAAECDRIVGYFDSPRIRFRSTVNMASHSFGRGVYKYFDYPLPADVQRLRESFYPNLARVANRWAERLRQDVEWPATLSDLTARCHAAGQVRPTPLMLRYSAGDYNCLHQDLYGPIHFPLQAAILLSKPNEDFSGGEFVLVEQRPRMQSRPIMARLGQGTAVIFPVQARPRKGVRGYHRTQMRHGVCEVTGGLRLTLGLIFHDAL